MNQASSWNAWDVLRLKEGHYSREDPSKKSPFQVAEKKKNATSSKQIQGTWCFGLNGHRRDPYVDDSVPEQCRLDVDLL